MLSRHAASRLPSGILRFRPSIQISETGAHAGDRATPIMLRDATSAKSFLSFPIGIRRRQYYRLPDKGSHRAAVAMP